MLAQNNCKQYLLDTYGEAYSAPKNFASKGSNSQEAHEAIRPTDVTFKAEELSLSQDHKKLYNLIWSRFVASQMPQPEIVVNSIKAKKAEKVFETSVSSISFDGFYKVMPPGKNSGYVDYDLEGLSVGLLKKISKVEKSQHFTKPPSRYSEASLVKELEKKSIGRPSTYQEIITNIQDRGYVNKENKRLYATKIANLISSKSNLVLAIGKEAFYKQLEQPMKQAYTYASKIMTENMMKKDAIEGINSFIEKRSPVWKNK